MSKGFVVLLMGVSSLIFGCGAKTPSQTGGTAQNGSATGTTPSGSPVTGTRTPTPTPPAQTSRYELWNRLIQNGANIILRVRDNSAAAPGLSTAYFEVNHLDRVTGQTCRITSSEYDIIYCCIDMLLARTDRIDNNYVVTESPGGCYDRQLRSLTGDLSLVQFSQTLPGGLDGDNYHFEHFPGRMTFNPLQGTVPNEATDTAVAIHFDAHPHDLPIYADPNQGTGARRNNIIGTWRMNRVLLSQ